MASILWLIFCACVCLCALVTVHILSLLYYITTFHFLMQKDLMPLWYNRKVLSSLCLMARFCRLVRWDTWCYIFRKWTSDRGLPCYHTWVWWRGAPMCSFMLFICCFHFIFNVFWKTEVLQFIFNISVDISCYNTCTKINGWSCGSMVRPLPKTLADWTIPTLHLEDIS